MKVEGGKRAGRISILHSISGSDSKGPSGISSKLPPSSFRLPPSRKRGAALLLILGILAVLGWLAAEIVRETLKQQSESAAFFRRERLRESAWSATECVVAALREKSLVDEGLFTVPHDGATLLKAVGFENAKGVRVAVTIADESGKLGWRALKEDDLRELLIDCGVPPDEAPKLTDTLLDRFQLSPNKRMLGMKRPEYADAGLPPPPERNPETYAELLDAPGMRARFTDEKGVPNDGFRNLISCLSLEGETTMPNLNTASPALLAHLHRLGLIPDADALLAWRNGPDKLTGTDDDRYARASSDLALSGAGAVSETAAFTVRRLRIETRVTFGDSSFLLTTDYDPSSISQGFPWKVMKAEENRKSD